jgi:hypothetical protein
MSEQATGKKLEYKSESSIFVHPIQRVKKDQITMPTWTIIVILFIAFFILKPFIYISDKKRHGK